MNTNLFTPTSSLNYGTASSDVPVSTVNAAPLTGQSSNLSAGNIVGAVAGTLIGLAVLFFLVVVILVCFFPRLMCNGISAKYCPTFS